MSHKNIPLFLKILKMHLSKTSEKILIWMHRSSITQQTLANKLGITRQTFAKKIKENGFLENEINILKSLGFNEFMF